MFTGIWRALVHASGSLAKARAFTSVCVVSLGVGMAPVIAIPYVSRLTTLTPPGVNTEELVELVTTSVGPRQQTQQWSYPDYVDLRDANTGITLIGWAGAQSELTFQATGGSKIRASRICLLTSLIFGWLPAMRFSRPVIIRPLRTMRVVEGGCGWGACIAGRPHCRPRSQCHSS